MLGNTNIKYITSHKNHVKDNGKHDNYYIKTKQNKEQKYFHV